MWPAKWGGHARPWLVENLDGGTARNGRVTAAADMQADGSNLHVTAFDASLLGDDVTIHWLRPVPPVEHAQAILRMRGIDAIDISVPTARQGTMQISNGVVRITGLSVKDQDLTVSSDVSAKVPELLALLKHPRLHLLSDHPIPVSNPAGTLAGKLEVTLPLENNSISTRWASTPRAGFGPSARRRGREAGPGAGRHPDRRDAGGVARIGCGRGGQHPVPGGGSRWISGTARPRRR